MGISKDTLYLIELSKKSVNKTWKNITVCEFGNQRFHDGATPFKTSKEYYKSLGAKHVSIDINGKDGALKKDLSRAISMNTKFDIVTNFGTIEHVENGQYSAFKNMHNLTKVNGVMVHVFPLAGHWKGHGHFHYGEGFPYILAEKNGYEMVYYRIIKKQGNMNLMCAILRKKTSKQFITEKQFNSMERIYAS